MLRNTAIWLRHYRLTTTPYPFVISHCMFVVVVVVVVVIVVCVCVCQCIINVSANCDNT